MENVIAAYFNLNSLPIFPVNFPVYFDEEKSKFFPFRILTHYPIGVPLVIQQSNGVTQFSAGRYNIILKRDL